VKRRHQGKRGVCGIDLQFFILVVGDDAFVLSFRFLGKDVGGSENGDEIDHGIGDGDGVSADVDDDCDVVSGD
jgi:hypothetical protein